MRKLIGYSIFWLFVASTLFSLWAMINNHIGMVVSLPIVGMSGRYVFKDTMNLVQGIGFVYWVTRDTHKGFSLSIGFMRETDYPWRTGKGLQIGISKYSFQLGFCKRHDPHSEIMGLTNALKGRELHYQPKEIREWR